MRLFAKFFLLFILVGIACRGELPLAQSPTLEPTRTPLPTFTPAPEIVQVTITFPPTATPLPPPTETPTPEPEPTEPPPPEPEPTEEATPEPEPTETPTPEPPPPPTEAPPPPPPTEPPPTEEQPADPPPPAEPGVGAYGVRAGITLRDGRNTYGVGEKVFFKIEATNTTDNTIQFGILGLNSSDGNFQTSWDNSHISAGETFRHEDGVAFGAPGNYTVWLSICFSSKEVCQSPDGNWERFEPGQEVTIQ